jgi:hypothetical protein
MMANLLLVLGVVALGAGLRSFNHPVSFRLGTLVIVLSSFLAGWLFSGSVLVGLVLAGSWFFLPWIEIVTRLRKVRLPLERSLEVRTPPARSVFPNLEELTDEIEAAGFEHVTDVGWEDDHVRQFYRVFRDAASTTQACICLAEQGELAFYYLTITSRTSGGCAYHSWNYPFPYGLKFSPAMRLNRISSGATFSEMLARHLQFLREEGISDSALKVLEDDKILPAMQQDLKSHILHNLDVGLLTNAGENSIRYTFRGMVFLWLQFLRDVVRIF